MDVAAHRVFDRERPRTRFYLKRELDMSVGGKKIIDGLKAAIAGDLSRVHIEGQTWVRVDRAGSTQAEIERLRAALLPFADAALQAEQTGTPADIFVEREHFDAARAAIEQLRKKGDVGSVS